MPDPAPPTEFATFERFCEAAGDMVKAGLNFARRDNPERFAECERARQRGAKAVLVYELGPPVAVALQLLSTGDGQPETLEVFRYQGRLARPMEVN
jgi:hypothetical protein